MGWRVQFCQEILTITMHCNHLTKRHWYDQKNRILAGQAIIYPFYMYTVELPTLLQYTAVLPGTYNCCTVQVFFHISPLLTTRTLYVL